MDGQRSCESYLSYLNELETEIRSSDNRGDNTDVGGKRARLLNHYIDAIEKLPEDWTDESYIIISFRHALLLLTTDELTARTCLGLIRMNCNNAQVFIAMAEYYLQQDDRSAARSCLERGQKRNAVPQSLIADAIRTLRRGGKTLENFIDSRFCYHLPSEPKNHSGETASVVEAALHKLSVMTENVSHEGLDSTGQETGKYAQFVPQSPLRPSAAVSAPRPEDDAVAPDTRPLTDQRLPSSQNPLPPSPDSSQSMDMSLDEPACPRLGYSTPAVTEPLCWKGSFSAATARPPDSGYATRPANTSLRRPRDGATSRPRRATPIPERSKPAVCTTEPPVLDFDKEEEEEEEERPAPTAAIARRALQPLPARAWPSPKVVRPVRRVVHGRGFYRPQFADRPEARILRVPPITSGSAHVPPSTSGSAHGPPITSGSAHGPPITSGTAHGPPITSGSAHGPPITSGSAHGPPITSGSAYGLPITSGSAHGLPITSGSAHGPPITSGTALGPPSTSGTALGLPITSGISHGPPITSGSAHGPPIPSGSAHGPPTTSGSAHGPPTTSGSAHGPPITSGSAHGPPITSGRAHDHLTTSGSAHGHLTTSCSAHGPPISSGSAHGPPITSGSTHGPPITSGTAHGPAVTEASEPAVSRIGKENRPHHAAEKTKPGADRKEAEKPDAFAFGRLPDRGAIRVNGTPYEVRGIIGRGGTSVVYQATNKEGDSLAIKVVSFDKQDDNVIASYKNEVEILLRLQDTGRVIRLFNHEITGHGMALVMERAEVDFKSVHAHLTNSSSSRASERPRLLAADQVVKLWVEMLKCVEAVHEKGVVHLDLKPANFVLVSGVPKLIDLGISHAIPDDMTSVTLQHTMGTLDYMSPEQLASLNQLRDVKNRIGRSSDVWALGCILHLLMFGKPPYRGAHILERMAQIVSDRPVPIPAYPALPRLREILDRCLQKEAARRPTVAALLQCFSAGV